MLEIELHDTRYEALPKEYQTHIMIRIFASRKNMDIYKEIVQTLKALNITYESEFYGNGRSRFTFEFKDKSIVYNAIETFCNKHGITKRDPALW